MPTLASLGLPDVRGRVPLLAGLAIDSFGGGCAGPLLLLFFTRVRTSRSVPPDSP
jgi:hypothetical protein